MIMGISVTAKQICGVNLKISFGFFVLVNLLLPLLAINIDTQFPLTFNGTPDSYFGYSVGLLNNTKGSWLIVGAPRANSTLQPQLMEPGDIFKCKVATEDCDRLILDPYGNTNEYIDRERKYREWKDNGWLGVSLDTTQFKEGRIVTCAHRWVNRYYDYHHLANGVCYTIDKEFDDVTFEKLTPLIAQSQQILPTEEFYYACAQGGISAHFIKDSDSLLLGAPGILAGKGSSVFMSRAESGIISKRSILENYATTIVPEPLTSLDIDAYFGYAITSGQFSKASSVQYAVGAPRQNYKGMVYIVEINRAKRFDVKVERSGEQLGEYFGGTLCAVDLNGDGLDDLLVGAPLHSKREDEGKVYSFINMGSANLQQQNEGLMGSVIAKSRFGSSIASIGDVNMDGYSDVAVGAPYENDHGAVYIYHGSKNGLKTNYQQKIEAKHGDPNAYGFGISIARGMDVDDNKYPDLAVGAYQSNKAFIFRCRHSETRSRPLIYLTGRLMPDRNQINMDQKDCQVGANPYSCFKLTVCLTCTGKYIPHTPRISARLTVDTLKGESLDSTRVFIKTDVGRPQISVQFNTSLLVGTEWCRDYDVYAPTAPQDYLTPIQISLTYDLVPNATAETKFCATCPIVDQSEHNEQIAKVRFMKHCGEDDKCDTDLQLKAWILDFGPHDAIIVGAQHTLMLHIEIYNAAEPAYLTMLFIDMPAWMHIDRKPPICDFTIRNRPSQLFCTVANPLKSKEILKLDLNLNLQSIPVKEGTLLLNITTESGSNEAADKRFDNQVIIEQQIIAMADFNVKGVAETEQALYEHDKKGKVEEGTRVDFSHHYEVANAGPSPINQMTIVVKYPALSLDGRRLINIKSLQKKNGIRGTHFGICEGEIGLASFDSDTDQIETVTLEPPDRQRRDLQDFETEDIAPNNETEVLVQRDFVLNCTTAICETISCIMGPFDKENSASLGINAVLDVTNLTRIMGDRVNALVFTEARISLSDPTSSIRPKHIKRTYATVATEVKPGSAPPRKEVATWIIVVSVIGGLLLLSLLIVALVKAGFFRRKEKEEMEKMQGSESLDSE